MPAYKDNAKGTWYVSFYFQNWKGERERKLKRGFRTKKEALEWEREFLQKQAADMDMTFTAFVELYNRDIKSRLRLNTWQTKENIIQNKLRTVSSRQKCWMNICRTSKNATLI